MKIKLSILLVIVSVHVIGQDFCGYGKAHIFDSHRTRIQTENAGLFPDAYTVGRTYYQIEGNFFGAAFRNKYENEIYGGLFKLRLGIGHLTEVQVGAAYAYPQVIRPIAWQEGRKYAGIKHEIFSNHKSEGWKIALSLNYIFQEVQQEVGNAVHGTNLCIHSSWSAGKAVYTDFTYGFYWFSNREHQHSVSCRIVMKKEVSKFGLFIGLAGDNYIESYANMGFVITDNYNYILNLGISIFDHASCPNISYTHKLKHTRRVKKRY